MEFLFDDDWIDRKAGVRRVLGEPVKHPSRVLKPETPWEEAGIATTPSLIYDAQEGKFKLWYKAGVPDNPARVNDTTVDPSEKQAATKRLFLCYAESQDGIRWIRPSLGRFQFRGSKDNNILREVADADTVFFNIVKDPLDPDPARHYKALGFAGTQTSLLRDRPQGGTGVAVAYSPDGLSWPSEPTLVMHTDDVTDADCLLGQRDPITGTWTAFLRPRTYPKRRFVGYAESRDFDHWTYPRMLITPDAGDDEWMEFYGIAPAVLENWYIGAAWTFHNNPASSVMRNELVYSRDGRHYKRALPGIPFLPAGPQGSFDSAMITPHAVIPQEAAFFIFYAGSNTEHGSDRGRQEMHPRRTAAGEQPIGGMGLARLPWGQFCGLKADIDGMVETKWLCNYGDSALKAVAGIEPDGSMQAELLDQYGSMIPGWSRAESRMRTDAGDHGKRAFYWERDDLVGRSGQESRQKGQVGHVVKVRFYLHRAALYGFELSPPGTMPAYLSVQGNRDS